jgi:hypothetical protein
MKFSAGLVAILSTVPALAIPSDVFKARKETVTTPKYYNIHPNSNKSKCISVKGGKFVAGSPVDVYDCNGSVTQKWSWGSNHVDGEASQVFVTNPANGENLCMDIPPLDSIPDPDVDIVNGVKLLLKKCYTTGDGWQSFSKPDDTNTFGVIQYSGSRENHGLLCVDLTDGSTVNGNVLQIWACSEDHTKPWKNQIWALSSV